MANGDGSKTPTWQWLAGFAISIILIIAGVSLTETRSDIRIGRDANAVAREKIAVIEKSNEMQGKINELQFKIIEAWREEVKVGMKTISDKLDKHEQTQATVKRWQDTPASR